MGEKFYKSISLDSSQMALKRSERSPCSPVQSHHMVLPLAEAPFLGAPEKVTPRDGRIIPIDGNQVGSFHDGKGNPLEKIRFQALLFLNLPGFAHGHHFEEIAGAE
jgi:hypothetical protein